MPITIENEEYEFDLKVNALSAGTVDVDFNLFLEVKNVLVIFPVKFQIEVLKIENGTGSLTQAEESQPLHIEEAR